MAYQHGLDLGHGERGLDPPVLQAVLEEHVGDGLHLVRVRARGRVRGRARGRVRVSVRVFTAIVK